MTITAAQTPATPVNTATAIISSLCLSFSVVAVVGATVVQFSTLVQLVLLTVALIVSVVASTVSVVALTVLVVGTETVELSSMEFATTVNFPKHHNDVEK